MAPSRVESIPQAMKTRHLLGWYNLVENKKRTLAAVVGIAFAILLLFMQMGLLAAVKTNALLVHESLAYDLLLLSPHYDYVTSAGEFSRDRLYAASSQEGVQSITPLYVARKRYRNPRTGFRYSVLLLGINPRDRPFHDDRLNAHVADLAQEDTALIDLESRPDVGPRKVGVSTELEDHKLAIIGSYRIGSGFAADGGLMISDRTWGKLLPGNSLEQVQLGLVRVDPAARLVDVQRRVRQALGPSVLVLTRAEAEALDTRQWLQVRPIGLMFTSGVFIGLVVGAVTLYQVLTSEVMTRLREYATLKALGYTNAYINGVVYVQAVLIVLIAYIPALAVSLILYEALRNVAQIPMAMTTLRILLVLVLNVAMSLAACTLAIRRVRTANPAELF